MFLNGINTVVAGGTAECEVMWTMPLPATTFAGALVTWELIDANGQVHNTGDAHTITVGTAAVGTDTQITAKATLAVPIHLTAAAYQVRWTLKYSGGQPAFAFDNFIVASPLLDNAGPQSGVALFGDEVELTLTLPDEVQSPVLQIAFKDKVIHEVALSNPQNVGGQAVYVAKFATAPLTPGPSITPYGCLWRYKQGGQPRIEHSNLWLVNPLVFQAQTELRNFLIKAYADTGLAPDYDFDAAALLQYLQQGCEMFNGLGYPTAFTMLRAAGPIRAWWLKCATVVACRSQYLAEGMKSFNYGGQVTTLDVDRSQFWDSTASQLQGEIDQHLKPFKENLLRRGVTSGDGDASALGLRFGAVGAVGIAITPISPLRGYSSGPRR